MNTVRTGKGKAFGQTATDNKYQVKSIIGIIRKKDRIGIILSGTLQNAVALIVWVTAAAIFESNFHP